MNNLRFEKDHVYFRYIGVENVTTERTLPSRVPDDSKSQAWIADSWRTYSEGTIETQIGRDTIHAIANLIVERFGPNQIILFGSHARNEAGKHSDVDLLVVLPEDAGWRKWCGNPIPRAIAERFVLPIDMIVRSPENVARHRDDLIL